MAASPQVLVVEDEPVIRLLIAELLTEQGYQVVGQAGDGLTAIRLAQELRPDVVLMDIKMPIMDGIEAATQINAERITPVVFVTAFSNAHLREQADAAGGFGYLVKPFTSKELLPVIDAALSRHAGQQLRNELASDPDARRLLGEAEARLAETFGMDAAEASAWLTGEARSRRVPVATVAADLLAGRVTPEQQGAHQDTIGVHGYLATDDPHIAQRVFTALDDLARALGYEDPVQETLERGSFWRKARAVLRAGVTSREVRDRLIKVERALELALLDARQAEVDGKQAGAVATLIAALADVPEACLRTGSILLIKHQTDTGPVLVTRNLSQVEIRALERFPEIQKHPRTVLTSLASAITRLEIDQGEPASH